MYPSREKVISVTWPEVLNEKCAQNISSMFATINLDIVMFGECTVTGKSLTISYYRALGTIVKIFTKSIGRRDL